MNVLVCSLQGDKRFTAINAQVKVNGVSDSIQNHISLSKRFIQENRTKVLIPQTAEEAEENKADFFVVKDIPFPLNYLPLWNKLLWVKYLTIHDELIKHASQFDTFEGEDGDIVRQYVMEGRDAILRECEPFAKVLRGETFVLETVGDVLASKENIVGHQVNCKGIMGGGIALSIRTKYPEVFNDYSLLCKQFNGDRYLMGRNQMIPTHEEGRFIANLFGQHGLGRDKVQTEKKHLRNALQNLKKIAQEQTLSVGLPYKLGCGLAGGNWSEVREIIEEVFYDYPVTIYKLPGVE